METRRGARWLITVASWAAVQFALVSSCGPPPCPRNTDRIPASCDEACTCSVCASMYARYSCGWRTGTDGRGRCAALTTSETGAQGPGAPVTSPELCTESASGGAAAH